MITLTICNNPPPPFPTTHTAIDVCNGSKVVADFRRVVFELTASMAPAHYMSEIDLLCSRRLIVYMCTTPYTAALCLLLLPLKNRVLKSHIRDHMLHLSLLWNIHKTFCRRIRCQKKNTYRSRRTYIILLQVCSTTCAIRSNMCVFVKSSKIFKRIQLMYLKKSPKPVWP